MGRKSKAEAAKEQERAARRGRDALYVMRQKEAGKKLWKRWSTSAEIVLLRGLVAVMGSPGGADIARRAVLSALEEVQSISQELESE